MKTSIGRVHSSSKIPPPMPTITNNIANHWTSVLRNIVHTSLIKLLQLLFKPPVSHALSSVCMCYFLLDADYDVNWSIRNLFPKSAVNSSSETLLCCSVWARSLFLFFRYTPHILKYSLSGLPAGFTRHRECHVAFKAIALFFPIAWCCQLWQIFVQSLKTYTRSIGRPSNHHYRHVIVFICWRRYCMSLRKSPPMKQCPEAAWHSLISVVSGRRSLPLVGWAVKFNFPPTNARSFLASQMFCPYTWEASRNAVFWFSCSRGPEFHEENG